MERLTVAGRAGRWAAAHWKAAFFGWLAFGAIAMVIGNSVGMKKQTDADAATRGSAKAEQILTRAHFKSPAGESVLVQSTSLTVDQPAFKAAIADVVARLGALEDVQNIRSPLEPQHGGQIAGGGHSALVQFSVRGDHDKAADKIEPMLDAVSAAQRAHPQLVVSEFGMASAMKELNDTVAKDFKRAEATTVPATLVILLLAFGALVAAGIPVLHGRSHPARGDAARDVLRDGARCDGRSQGITAEVMGRRSPPCCPSTCWLRFCRRCS